MRGRGALHISILMENMRREGFEFAVGPPKARPRRAWAMCLHAWGHTGTSGKCRAGAASSACVSPPELCSGGKCSQLCCCLCICITLMLYMC